MNPSDEAQSWVRSQLQAFTGWLNGQLVPLKISVDVSSLSEQLCDGVILARLIQTLESRKLPGKVIEKPKILHHRMENMGLVLKWLVIIGIKNTTWDESVLVDSHRNLKMLLSVLWELIRHYSPSLQLPVHGTSGGTHFSAHLGLWIQQLLGEDVKISDFKESFSSGVLFCRIVNALHADDDVPLIDIKSLKSDGAANCKLAFNLAAQRLSVPKMIDPVEVSKGLVDELSIMTYLSLLHLYQTRTTSSQGFESEQQKIRVMLNSTGITLQEMPTTQNVTFVNVRTSQPQPVFGCGPVIKLTISLLCRDLIPLDLMKKSDPIIGVFRKEIDGSYTLVAQTEWIPAEHNPMFKTHVTLFYCKPWGDVEYKFSVYDADTDQIRPEDLMGSATVTLNELLHSAPSPYHTTPGWYLPALPPQHLRSRTTSTQADGPLHRGLRSSTLSLPSVPIFITDDSPSSTPSSSFLSEPTHTQRRSSDYSPLVPARMFPEELLSKQLENKVMSERNKALQESKSTILFNVKGETLPEPLETDMEAQEQELLKKTSMSPEEALLELESMISRFKARVGCVPLVVMSKFSTQSTCHTYSSDLMDEKEMDMLVSLEKLLKEDSNAAPCVPTNRTIRGASAQPCFCIVAYQKECQQRHEESAQGKTDLVEV